MKTDRIDFISAYCDRWCERCAFTLRCSAFACEAAIAMCGDAEEGFELAIGQPHPVEGKRAEPPDFVREIENLHVSAKELADIEREEAERDERVAATPLSAAAHDYSIASHRWLHERLEPLRASADAMLADALDVAIHDSLFIGAKLHRALHGRAAFASGEDDDDHPVQNDWNGSAKVALISLQRSEAAWRVVAQATGDEGASVLGDSLAELLRLAGEEFPDAMSFVRPGFDEPWR